MAAIVSVYSFNQSSHFLSLTQTHTIQLYAYTSSLSVCLSVRRLFWLSESFFHFLYLIFFCLLELSICLPVCFIWMYVHTILVRCLSIWLLLFYSSTGLWFCYFVGLQPPLMPALNVQILATEKEGLPYLLQSHEFRGEKRVRGDILSVKCSGYYFVNCFANKKLLLLFCK